jgi:hypothetical protein
MATPITAQPEPGYGDKVALEQSADAVAAAAPPPAVPIPEPVDPNAPVAPPVQQAQPGQQNPDAVHVANPFMLLPPGVNFPDLRPKTEIEQQYDVSRLWEVLATAPNADPTVVAIAKAMRGE